MPLLAELSDLRGRLQGDLFPFLQTNLGPLGPKYQQLVAVIEMVPVDAFLPRWGRGRPPYDRAPFARAFLAKTIFNLPTTADLIVRLQSDETMRILAKAKTAPDVRWDSREASLYRVIFPQMANRLPVEEAARLRLEFATELAPIEEAA